MCLTCRKAVFDSNLRKKGAAPHGAAPSCVSFSNIYLVNLPL